MKKPIAIIFNDAHLKVGNEEAVISSVRHMIEVATEKGINRILFAGDLFDSRSFQRLNQLRAFDKILKLFQLHGIKADFIPGNHDKTLYASHDSFLDVFKWYPGFKLHSSLSVIEIEGVSISMLPFFSDDMLIHMIENAEPTDVLVSHFEMAGSTNLGNKSEKTTINEKLLSKWKKVYLGHYHNHHEITKDIVHLPSLIQAKFGEDNNKGFSILYDDLSYEIIKGKFRELIKIEINLNDVTTAELKGLIKTHSNSPNTIRFEFKGDESKLKALDKSLFKETGIDVKVKYQVKYDYEDRKLEYPKVTERYSKEDVRKTFKEFCKEKGYDESAGQEILEEFLKQQ